MKNDSLTFGVVMDPISNITPYKDTSLLIMLAAQARGITLYYIEPKNLMIDQGKAYAIAQKAVVYDNNEHWYELQSSETIRLDSLDAIIMRQEPPFNNEFLYATHVLDLAAESGTLVANKPQALRDFNEKLFAMQFPECIPPVLVSAHSDAIKRFQSTHGNIILKPLNGMGGQGIFHIKSDTNNLNVAIEVLTNQGREAIMVQRYIPEIINGDKRILIVDGQVIPYCLARIPAKGETRGNLAAGGKGQTQAISERDKIIAETIAPTLVEQGILFAGIDVIGDYLTEINITSPTCAREIDNAYNTDIGGKLIDAIINRLT